MKTKKVVALLLSAWMVFALAACGKTNEEAPVEEPEETVEDVAEEGETAAEETIPEAASDLFDTTVPVTGKPDKAGFNSDTNMTLEDPGFTVSIPRYFGEDQGSGDTHQYYAETGDSVVLFQVSCENFTMTADQFKGTRDKMFDAFIGGMKLDNCVIKPTKSGGRYFEGAFQGLNVRGEVDIFYSETASRYCVVAIMATDTAKYDYFPDFDKIRKAIVVK